MTATLPQSIRSAVTLAMGVGIACLTWSVSAPQILFSDYIKGYYPAGQATWRGADALEPLYDSMSFVNLPIVAWLLAPLSLFGTPERAAWAYFALGVLAVVASYGLLLSLSKRRTIALALTSAFLFLVNGPLIYSFREGNLSHVVLLMLVLAFVAWRARFPITAGALLGVCAVIKMPLLLFAPYLLVKQHWRSLIGMTAPLVLAVVLSLSVFGVDATRVWYERCIGAFSGGAVAAYNVQTLDAFLLRLDTGAVHLRNYLPVPRSRPHALFRGASLTGLFILTAWGLSRRRAPAGPDLLELSLVLTAALVISPLAWSHYFCMLLLPWILYLGGNLPLPPGAVTKSLMIGSMVLSSFPVLRTDLPLLFSPVASRTIASACFVGALLLLLALLRGLLAPPRTQEARVLSA